MRTYRYLKISVIIKNDNSIRKRDIYFFEIDNIDSDKYLRFKMIHDMDFGRNLFKIGFTIEGSWYIEEK